jgi:hypothetical protein
MGWFKYSHLRRGKFCTRRNLVLYVGENLGQFYTGLADLAPAPGTVETRL